MEELRQTGRTTRMLEEAKRLTREGRAVYVIAANKNEQLRIAKLLGNENPYNNEFGIKIETPDTPGNFNWETLSLIGAHPRCAVLVDHFAIEKHIGYRLLNELHKFDLTHHRGEK